MRNTLSAGLCLEVLNFVLQRKRVSVTVIQSRFRLSYHNTQLIVEVLEKYGIISPKNHNLREVIAPFKVKKKHLQSEVDNNWSIRLLKGIKLN